MTENWRIKIMYQVTHKHLPYAKKQEILNKLGDKPKKELLNQVCHEYQVHVSTVKNWQRKLKQSRGLEYDITGGFPYKVFGNPLQEEQFQTKQRMSQDLDYQNVQLRELEEKVKKSCQMIAQIKTHK